jgi:NADPH:quinone reductase-like Zn-dependent oxidoreductase
MIKEKVMRAIQFKAFGDPSVLELTEVPAPAVGETMSMVRVMAASINPSDVKNVAGAMKQTTLPGSPAVISPEWSRRGRPTGLGPRSGALAAITGFTRDGTHAEMITKAVRKNSPPLPIAVLDLLQFLAQRAAKELRRMERALVWHPSNQQYPGGTRCGDLEIAVVLLKRPNRH